MNPHPHRTKISRGVLTLLSASALQALPAHAAQWQTSDDITTTTNATLRYNLGMRAESPDNVLINTPANDASTLSVASGRLYTNRVDLLGELEVNYRQSLGLRISAAAWYDAALPSQPRYNPALGSPYAGDAWSSHTQRFHEGPSAEILDGFVHGHADLGSIGTTVRLGRSVVLWGESIVGTHGISVNQAPTDLFKVLANPGASSKETALPLGQLWMQFDLSPQWAVEAQYVYEFRPNRYPQGGTMLAITDFMLNGPDQYKVGPGPAPTLRNAGWAKPDKGQGGLSLRWSPNTGALAGDMLGLHVRQFNETNFWFAVNPPGGSFSFAFPESTRLIGLSYGTKAGGAQVGAELSMRQNAALLSAPALINNEGARGKTVHALVNATKLVGPTSAWDMLVVSGELSMMRMAGVTKNAALYNACANDQVGANCATRDFAGLLLVLAPSWTAVAPGLDLGVTAALNLGLKGNAATLAAGNENNGSYSVGFNATYNAVHRFGLQWNDGLAHKINNVVNGPALMDRGRVTFTYEVPLL